MKEPSTTSDEKPDTKAGQYSGTVTSLLRDHKGKLAIGVAATLGAMIFYGWREKMLAQEDPEEYARLQRIKDSFRHGMEDKSVHEQGSP